MRNNYILRFKNENSVSVIEPQNLHRSMRSNHIVFLTEENMEMYQDGVECFVILGFCEADNRQKSIFELEQCPLGKDECDGDCEYYSEDLKG